MQTRSAAEEKISLGKTAENTNLIRQDHERADTPLIKHYDAAQIMGDPKTLTEMIANIYNFSKNPSKPEHMSADNPRMMAEISDGWKQRAIFLAASAYKDGLYDCTYLVETKNGITSIHVMEHNDSRVKLPKELITDEMFGSYLKNTTSWPGYCDDRLNISASEDNRMYVKYAELAERMGATFINKEDEF